MNFNLLSALLFLRFKRDGLNFTLLFLFIAACSTSLNKPKAKSQAPFFSPSSATLQSGTSGKRTLAFLWPIDGKPKLSSYFGWRKKGQRTKGERMHEGIDLLGYTGQKLRASASGRAIEVAWVAGYGRTVIIYHGDGWSTLYAHLSKYNVKKGQEVKAGEVIGFMGRSGRATAVHLHFEVRKGADPLDPLLFLPTRELERHAPKGFYGEGKKK